MEVPMKKIALAGLTLWLLLACGYAQQNKNAPPAGKKEYVFKGKVEKVDLTNKTFTVNGEKVEGWMDSMTMSYVPDKEDVLKKVKVGDQITAKVYDGDFRTLHDVQVVPAKPEERKTETKPPAKK
jgi:Cu/Ag efflux protein CusF